MHHIIFQYNKVNIFELPPNNFPFSLAQFLSLHPFFTRNLRKWESERHPGKLKYRQVLIWWNSSYHSLVKEYQLPNQHGLHQCTDVHQWLITNFFQSLSMISYHANVSSWTDSKHVIVLPPCLLVINPPDIAYISSLLTSKATLGWREGKYFKRGWQGV